jgi:hypothetical protein
MVAAIPRTSAWKSSQSDSDSESSPARFAWVELGASRARTNACAMICFHNYAL